MELQKLLDEIKATNDQITTLNNLRTSLAERPEGNRDAGISCKGSWSVWFNSKDVDGLLQQREDGLNVKLNRLLAAKKAAEITMEGWLNSPGGENEQNRT